MTPEQEKARAAVKTLEIMYAAMAKGVVMGILDALWPVVAIYVLVCVLHNYLGWFQ